MIILWIQALHLAFQGVKCKHNFKHYSAPHQTARQDGVTTNLSDAGMQRHRRHIMYRVRCKPMMGSDFKSQEQIKDVLQVSYCSCARADAAPYERSGTAAAW